MSLLYSILKPIVRKVIKGSSLHQEESYEEFKQEGSFMNWTRTILDGVAMAMLFNAVAGVGFMLWLLKPAIPEHALGWTFLVCPIAGFVVAGLATLLG